MKTRIWWAIAITLLVVAMGGLLILSGLGSGAWPTNYKVCEVQK